MKTICLMGNMMCIKPSDRILSVKGDNNSNKLCFLLERYVGELDLSTLSCIIKLSNAQKISDIVSPEVLHDETAIEVIWSIGENATSLNGALEVQLEFHNQENQIVWQSSIAEFIIENSLSSNSTFEQTKPTILSQWEKRVDTKYSEISNQYNEIKGSVDKIDEMSAELENLFENVLPSVTGDAMSVNGKKVDDTKTDILSLWTSQKIKTEIDHSQNVGAFFRAEAIYQNGFYVLDIADKSSVMPTNFQVTFTPPTDFAVGDKIRISGTQNVKNLYGKGFQNSPEWFHYSEAIKLENGYARFAQSTPTEFIDEFSIVNAAEVLKPNTTYTIVAEVTENTVTGGNFILAHPTLADDCFSVAATLNSSKGTGLFKLKTTTDVDLTGKRAMRITMLGTTAGTITLRVMLLAGDWTNKAIPSNYWENTYGEYQIVPYGKNATPFAAGIFAAGQPVTLNVGLSGAYFS